jgi:hypothetical protein
MEHVPGYLVVALAIGALVLQEWRAAGALTMLGCVYFAVLRRRQKSKGHTTNIPPSPE